VRMIAALFFILAVSASHHTAFAQKVSPIDFVSRDGMTIEGYLMRPLGKGRRPAIIALHGCGGPLSRKTGRLSKRHLAWGRILVGAGFVVFFPDSFGSRGFGSLCRIRRRPVKHRDRRRDVAAARRWLRDQAFVKRGDISVLGWSNGGSTALRIAASRSGGVYRNIITFYPGCRTLLKRRRKSAAPLKIIMGAADDWTPPEPCARLAKLWDAKIILYAGAYHSFDTPNSRVRVRRGMAYSKYRDGVVHVGTNKKARQMAIQEVLRTLQN